MYSCVTLKYLNQFIFRCNVRIFLSYSITCLGLWNLFGLVTVLTFNTSIHIPFFICHILVYFSTNENNPLPDLPFLKLFTSVLQYHHKFMMLISPSLSLPPLLFCSLLSSKKPWPDHRPHWESNNHKDRRVVCETDGSISERCELKDEEGLGEHLLSASINSLAILLKVHVKEAKHCQDQFSPTLLCCSVPNH